MRSVRMVGAENRGLFKRFWFQEFSAGGGMVTQIFSQRLGAMIAYLGCRTGISPNLLTLFALATSLGGSLLYAFGSPGWMTVVLCALMYQVAYGFDCSDGQLARATRRSSAYGGWLDVMADLISLLVMAFALLYWLIATRGDSNWIIFSGPLAIAIGRVLVLYSSKFTEGVSHVDRPGYGGSVGKKLLWFVIDTPTLLLVACFLREFPILLNSYLIFMGGLYCLNAAYLGFTRLPRHCEGGE